MRRYILWLLLVLQAVIVGNNAAAAQCYANVEKAYRHLLAQEQVNQQRLQAGSSLPVNINTAMQAQLMSLKGIGNSKAAAIIEYRNTVGPFATVDDLSKVKGIGAKTVEKNRQRLTVH